MIRCPGLAIVAHSIELMKIPKIKEDPFSADGHPQCLNDTCLEIEMLRGRDLQVQSLAKLVNSEKQKQDEKQNVEDGAALTKTKSKSRRKDRLASLLKGKGTDPCDKIREIPFEEVECNPEVRLYIDPRCSQTSNYLMSQLCMNDLTSDGYTSDALVISFAETLDGPSNLIQPLFLFHFPFLS